MSSANGVHFVSVLCQRVSVATHPHMHILFFAHQDGAKWQATVSWTFPVVEISVSVLPMAPNFTWLSSKLCGGKVASHLRQQELTYLVCDTMIMIRIRYNYQGVYYMITTISKLWICMCTRAFQAGCHPHSKVHGANMHGAHLSPAGPRWAPCWPHEPCYQGSRPLPPRPCHWDCVFWHNFSGMKRTCWTTVWLLLLRKLIRD